MCIYPISNSIIEIWPSPPGGYLVAHNFTRIKKGYSLATKNYRPTLPGHLLETKKKKKMCYSTDSDPWRPSTNKTVPCIFYNLVFNILTKPKWKSFNYKFLNLFKHYEFVIGCISTLFWSKFWNSKPVSNIVFRPGSGLGVIQDPIGCSYLDSIGFGIGWIWTSISFDPIELDLSGHKKCSR